MTTSPSADRRRPRRLRQRIQRAGLAFDAGILEILITREPRNPAYLAALGNVYTQLGKYRQGLEIDSRLVAVDPTDPIHRYNLACSLTLTGDLDGACHQILQALDLGFDEFDKIFEDPDLERLRADPRFAVVDDRVRDLR